MASTDDWIFSKEYIEFIEQNDASEKGRIIQREYRSKTVWFMEDLAKTMKIDRKVLSTACIYFHRFYMYHTFSSQDRYSVAVACLFLASKVEDRPIKIKDIVLGYCSVRKDKSDVEMQKKVLLSERIILNTLGFDLNVTHPYMACSAKLKDFKAMLTEESSRAVYQAAVNFMNDCYRSTLYLQYRAQDVGLASLYMATIYLAMKPQINLPSSTNKYPAEQTWLGQISKGADENIIREICLEIVELYNNNAYYLKLEDKGTVFRQSAYRELGLSYQHEENNSNQHSTDFSPSNSTQNLHRYNDEEEEDQPYEEYIQRQVKVSRVTSNRKNTMDDDEYPQYTHTTATDTPASISGTEYKYDDEDSTPFIPTKASDTPNSPNGFSSLPQLRMRERSMSLGDDSVGEYKRSRHE